MTLRDSIVQIIIVLGSAFQFQWALKYLNRASRIVDRGVRVLGIYCPGLLYGNGGSDIGNYKYPHRDYLLYLLSLLCENFFY